jgi:hypothetical protein
MASRSGLGHRSISVGFEEQADSAPILTSSIANLRLGKHSKLHELDHQSHVDYRVIWRQPRLISIL